ncbi:MAG: hypothetical protein JWR38_4948 [Mucilaginibacter sp.]|nr:hypothetical protein [Mucilaginibacter sp.]
MKILIRFKHRCVSDAKGGLDVIERVFINKINIYDTLISQLILKKKYRFIIEKRYKLACKLH